MYLKFLFLCSWIPERSLKPWKSSETKFLGLRVLTQSYCCKSLPENGKWMLNLEKPMDCQSMLSVKCCSWPQVIIKYLSMLHASLSHFWLHVENQLWCQMGPFKAATCPADSWAHFPTVYSIGGEEGFTVKRQKPQDRLLHGLQFLIKSCHSQDNHWMQSGLIPVKGQYPSLWLNGLASRANATAHGLQMPQIQSAWHPQTTSLNIPNPDHLPPICAWHRRERSCSIRIEPMASPQMPWIWHSFLETGKEGGLPAFLLASFSFPQ